MALSAVDPITLGVVWGALQSIAVEIGTTVHRTAYSEQAREGQDFSVAVFDAQGRMVAQGPYSPGHMGAMSFAVRNALAAHDIDRKSTRLNSSHDQISYAVFCLKKKKTTDDHGLHADLYES